MLDKRKRKMMENLDRCYKVVQQSRTGTSAIKVAEELKIHRTTAHSYLNTLELMGKVYSEKGLWYAKTRRAEGSEETELDKAKAYQIMRLIPSLFGHRILTKEDWDYFNQDNGKSKLDKAQALLLKKSVDAVIG